MDNWGLSERGFYRPEYLEILDTYEQRTKELFGADINLATHSIFGMLLRVLAWFSGLSWQLAETIYNAGFVDTAVGVSLARIGALIGIRPLSAAKATGELTFTGDPETLVPAGLLVSATNNTRFVVLQDVQIGPGGTVMVAAQAYETGPDGNVAAGTITTITTPISGVTAVVNGAAFMGGRDRETDAEFRARYQRSAKASGGANEDAIRDEIMLVDGALQAAVYSNETDETDSEGLPPHSINCVVEGGQDMAIAQAIYAKKAAGIMTYGNVSAAIIDASGATRMIRFSRPDPLQVWVRITGLVVAAGSSEDSVKQAIVDAVVLYVNTLGVGVSVVYVQILPEVSKVSGVLDFGLQLSQDGSAWSTDNIPVTSRQIAATDAAKVVIPS